MYQRIFTTTMNFIVPNSSAKLECVEFRENNSREHYARLVLGPVAPGQGVTLGNTFRRLLLMIYQVLQLQRQNSIKQEQNLQQFLGSGNQL